MAALHSRWHAVIIFSSCGFYLSFFPRLLSAVADYHTVTHDVVSANLDGRSEICCTRLVENTGRKNRQNSPSAHHRTTLSDYIFAVKAHIENRKKLLNSNISSTCSHNMVNLCPLTFETGFNEFRVLASLLHRRRLTEVNQTLHDIWPSPGLVLYVYISGGSCPLTEFCQVQYSLRPSLAFSYYIGSVTARHSSSGLQPNFAASYKE